MARAVNAGMCCSQARQTPSPASTTQAVLAVLVRLTKRHTHAQVRRRPRHQGPAALASAARRPWRRPRRNGATCAALVPQRLVCVCVAGGVCVAAGGAGGGHAPAAALAAGGVLAAVVCHGGAPRRRAHAAPDGGPRHARRLDGERGEAHARGLHATLAVSCVSATAPRPGCSFAPTCPTPHHHKLRRGLCACPCAGAQLLRAARAAPAQRVRRLPPAAGRRGARHLQPAHLCHGPGQGAGPRARRLRRDRLACRRAAGEHGARRRTAQVVSVTRAWQE